MPLTSKGEEIKSALTKEYGSEEKGEQVLYAGKNKGTFSGIDCDKIGRIADAVNNLAQRFDAIVDADQEETEQERRERTKRNLQKLKENWEKDPALKTLAGIEKAPKYGTYKKVK
jgi:hypothetical protein